MRVMDVNGQEIALYHGYVPYFLRKRNGYEDYAQMAINIETGEILNWINPIGDIKVNDIFDRKVPKTIYISAYCCDCFDMSVMDANWQEIVSYSGYVPSFMPNGGGCGDYVQMEIDLETGRILDWTDPKGDSEFDDILREGERVPTTVSITAHCSDKFGMSVMDTKGEWIASYDGYVPSFMPDKGGYGDAVQMTIEIETGKILDWENPRGQKI